MNLVDAANMATMRSYVTFTEVFFSNLFPQKAF